MQTQWEIETDDGILDIEADQPFKSDNVKKMDWNGFLKQEKGLK